VVFYASKNSPQPGARPSESLTDEEAPTDEKTGTSKPPDKQSPWREKGFHSLLFKNFNPKYRTAQQMRQNQLHFRLECGYKVVFIVA